MSQEQTLTGAWRGYFSYPGELSPIAFEAQLHESGESVSDLVHEVDDDGRGQMTFTAIIEGMRQGREIEFRKTYDDFDPICIVDYVGTLDSEGLQIAGEWVRLDDMLSGPFVMQRQSAGEQPLERELEAEFP